MLQRLGVSRAMKHWNDARDTLSFESCSFSMACDMEEVCSESSKKMKDVDETTSEARGKEKEVRRLEPEGEAEKPEARGLWGDVKRRLRES